MHMLARIEGDDALGRDVEDVAIEGEFGLVAEPAPSQRVEGDGPTDGDVAHHRQRGGRSRCFLSAEETLEHDLSLPSIR